MPRDPLLLPAGELRHVITILAPTISNDGISGSVATYSALFTDVRAKIEPMHGIELIRAGLDVTQTFVTITIRWIPGIVANQQVQGDNGTYIIQNIENVLERNRVLKLMCLGIGANS